MPVDASASRTVIRTPRNTGTSAAASGTSSPTATSIAITCGGTTKVPTSKLARPAVNDENAQAPAAPSGSATNRASTAYASTRPRYSPAIWSLRAPIAFITPIWRVCWARIADTVLTTRNPDTTRASPPMNAEHEEEARQQVVRG